MKRFLSPLFAVLLFAATPVFADCVLRQSDTIELTFGPFVDQTDGFTAETALTISQADVRLKKCTAAGDCAAWAQINEATSATHEENGWYEKDLNTTDTDTVGILQIAINESGALPVFKECLVVEEAVFDRDFTASSTGIVGTAQTGDSFARLGAPAGASVSADILVLDNFIDTEVSDILTDTSTTLDDLVDDLESRVGTPSNLGGGATLAANNVDIEGQTDDIGAAGAGLTAADDAVISAVAGVQSDTDNIQTRIPAALVSGRIDASVGAMAADTVTASAVATDAIGSSEWATTANNEVVDQVWEEAIGDHSATVGSTAEALASAGGGGATDQELGILRQGTAAAATATTLDMDTGATFANDTAIGMTVVACGSTQGYCQSRGVTDNTLTNDRLTVDTWTVTPSGTITFYLFGTAPGGSGGGLDAAGVRAAVGLASANLDTQLSTIDDFVDTEVAAILVDTGTTLDDLVDDLESRMGTPSNFGGGATLAGNNVDIEGQTDDIGAAGAGLTAADDATITAVAGVQTDTDNIQTRLPAALVSSRMDSSVGAMATDTITASAVAPDAIASSELAATAATEVASAVGSLQGLLTGTCDSGSTTTCVDDALTQASALQLEDRLICFDDGWCALLTTFTPGTDTATTTKVAPTTRASKVYTIFPSTLE